MSENPNNEPTPNGAGPSNDGTGGNIPPNNNAGGNPPPNNVKVNPFLMALFWLFAIVTGFCWNWTIWPLIKNTYTNSYPINKDRVVHEPNGLNILIGAVVSLGAGIGLGYHLGWQGEATWYNALGNGAVMSAIMAFVIWPALFAGSKLPRRLSNWLWSFVNMTGNSYRSYSSSEKEGNPHWFSRVLMVVGFGVIVLTGLDIAYQVASYVQAHQSFWLFWGVGWILAFLGAIICVIAAIVLIIATFAFVGKGPGLILIVVGLGLYSVFNVPINEFFGGMFNALRGSNWGIWGYIPGGLFGIITGGGIGVGLGFLLANWGMRLVALASGMTATYFLSGYTDQLLSTLPVDSWTAHLGPLTYAPAALPWVTYLVEVGLFYGIVFPAMHIFVTHVLKVLKDILDFPELMSQTYGEKSGGYREWFLQIAAIAGAICTFWFGPAHISWALGLTNPLAVYAVTAALTWLVYSVGYKIIDGTGTWPFGAASALYAGYWMHGYTSAHNWPHDAVVQWVVVALTVVLTFVPLFPMSYIIVRKVFHYPALWSRDALLRFHARFSRILSLIWDHLFELGEQAYGDTSPYREVFLHVANIIIAIGVLAGAAYGGMYFGAAPWLTWVSAIALSFMSYCFTAQLLLRTGAWPIGFVVASVVGIWAGIHIHGAQPLDWGTFRYGLSIFGGLVTAAAVFGIPVPLVYLVPAWLAGEASLRKDGAIRVGLMSGYARIWTPLSMFWTNVRAARKSMEAQWDAAKKQFESQWSAFNDKNKKK